MMTLGILHTTIRKEEKLIIQAAKLRGVNVQLIDVRTEVFNPKTYVPNFDIALERSVSTTKGTYATFFLESLNKKVVNPSSVALVCADKFLTSLALQKAGIPIPSFALVFNFEEAKKAISKMGGFPVVIKPNIGSWGRLLSRVNDEDALEAVIEHKEFLGSPQQKPIYIQKYIEKPGRDIRAFVVGGKTICAIYRESIHWITNTSRGAKASNCPLGKELVEITKNASLAIGGGILAIDLFETSDGLLVNEINHTMEFRNSEEPTKTSISGAMVDYCIETYKNL